MVRYCISDNVEIVDIAETVRLITSSETLQDHFHLDPTNLHCLHSGTYWYIRTCAKKYVEKEKLTLRYRNMKFSRNDLPFRKAPEKMWLSAISYSVSFAHTDNIHNWAIFLMLMRKIKGKEKRSLPATDMMQMGLSLMLSLFKMSLSASSSRKNLCVSLSSSIFTIWTALPMILPVRLFWKSFECNGNCVADREKQI